MAFIVVVLGMLLFGSLGLSLVSTTTSERVGQVDDVTAAQAFYVAEGGLQYLIMKQLSGDQNFSDNVSPTGAPFGGTPVSLGNGQFGVEYLSQATDSAQVRITARVGNAVRTIRQAVGQGRSGYQYVTMAGGNLNMNSSTGDIYGDVGIHGNV